MSQPQPSWSDPELADHLEGLLDPAVAAALSAELERDPALRARREALARALPEPLRLPPLPPPSALASRVAARLRELPRDAELADALEGLGDEALLAREPERAAALALSESLPRLPAPPGLLGEVLARLEAEGLARPSQANPRPSDAELADLLEGALEPGAAEALELALGGSPALRARLAALEAALPASPRLPELSPPAGLLERTLAALPQDPLPLAELDPAAPLPLPAGLLSATLERLSAEGLVEAAPSSAPASLAPASLDPASLDPARVSPASAAPAPVSAAPAPVLADASPAPAAPAAPAALAASAAPAAPAAPAAASPDPVLAVPAESPARGLLLRLPAWGAPLVAAALLLIGLGLGRQLAPAPGQGDTTLAELERLRGAATEAEGARAAAERARAARGEAERELTRLRDRLQRVEDAGGDAARLRAELTRQREELGARERELTQARQELQGAQARVAQLDQRSGEALSAREAEARAAREALARAEGALAQVRADLQQARGELGRAQRGLGEALQARRAAEEERGRAQAEALRLQAALDRPAPGLPVARAAAVERWDPHLRRWVPLRASDELRPGEVVRGQRVSSTLQVADLPPYQLRTGLYVVRDERRLDPLPAGGGWGGWSEGPTARRGGRDGEDPHGLIDRLQSELAIERAEAQDALRQLYVECGGDGTPPTTARGWERWWSEEGADARRR